jgi:RNA polymerase sigma-70 factor (ECF subfamily)
MTQQYANIDRLVRKTEKDLDLIVETLVDNFYSDLLYLAKTILREDHEAEDVVQETLLIVMSKIDQYEPGTNFKAWLYTIGVNISRKYYRKRKIRQNLSALLEKGFLRDESESSPEETFLKNETDTQLWQAVNSLKEKHRLPIILRYLHGLRCREIAQVLNINEGTVRSRLHYGIKKLQGIYQMGGKLSGHDGRMSR